MLQLSIENISMKFDELHQLKANNWKQMDPIDKKVGRGKEAIYFIYLFQHNKMLIYIAYVHIFYCQSINKNKLTHCEHGEHT